jgi:hypothetical protein
VSNTKLSEEPLVLVSGRIIDRGLDSGLDRLICELDRRSSALSSITVSGAK